MLPKVCVCVCWCVLVWVGVGVGGGGLRSWWLGGGPVGAINITIITFCSYICLGNAWGGYINISPYHVFTLIFSIAIEKKSIPYVICI